MVWGKAGTKTLTTAGTTVTTPTMTPSKFNVTLGHTYGTGNVNTRLRVGIDSIDVTSKYSNRYADNGGSDDITETTANVIRVSSRDRDELNVVYGCNIAGEEKLFYGFTVNQENTGATSPTRTAFSAKWITTAGQYNLIQWLNSSADFPVGSNMTALGNEITPTTGKPTDVQLGSRFEETDTRKMYHKVDVTGSDVSLTGLKAYYKFNEASGNIINQAESVGSSDSIGTNADMTITGATYDQTGIIGKALSFDGSNDYGTLGSSLSNFNFLHGTGDWSINFWVKYDEFIAEDRFLSNLDSTELRGMDMAVGWNGDPDGSLGMAIKSDNGFMVNQGGFTFPATVSAGAWVMITMTCDYSDTTNTYKVYLNGSAGGTQARGTTGSTGNSEYSLKLACRGNAVNKFFDGSFDELSIWQRELSQSEITSLYNSGNGKEINSDVWSELGT